MRSSRSLQAQIDDRCLGPAEVDRAARPPAARPDHARTNPGEPLIGPASARTHAWDSRRGTRPSPRPVSTIFTVLRASQATADRSECRKARPPAHPGSATSAGRCCIRCSGRHGQLVMVGAELLGDGLRVAQLAVGRLAEPDREGLDRLGAVPRHQRHDRGGIDAAGQEGAKRHVAKSCGCVTASSSLSRKAPTTSPDARGSSRGVVVGAAGSSAARSAAASPRRAWQPGISLRMPREQRVRARAHSDRRNSPRPPPIDLGLHAAEGQQRLDLGGEQQACRCLLATGTAASCRSGRAPGTAAGAARPRWRRRTCRASACTHAVAPCLVGVHDDLRVGVRAKRWPVRRQLVAQFLEVVDLAVEGRAPSPPSASHIGWPPVEIDDGEPAMAQDHRALPIPRRTCGAVPVGTAVGHALEHAIHGRDIDAARRTRHHARDPHTAFSPSGRHGHGAERRP